jgi:hypothetical protein
VEQGQLMAGKGRTLTVYLAADTKRAKQDVTGFTSFLKSDFVRGIAAGASAVAVFNAALDAMASAAQDAKAQANIGNLLGNLNLGGQATAVNAWVDSMQAAYGVLDTDLRAGLERLLPVTKNVADAQGLIVTAMNAAAGSGKEFSSVVEALTKAAGGSSTALLKLFPELRNVAGASTDLAAAQDALNQTYGGSAQKAADSYAGQLERLQIAADEAAETIGGALLEALGSIAGDGGIDGAVGVIGDFADATGNLIRGVGLLIAKLEDYIPEQAAAAKETVASKNATLDWTDALANAEDPLSFVGNLIYNAGYNAQVASAGIQVLADRYNGLAGAAAAAAAAIAASNAARAQNANADRYTALAVQRYGASVSFTGGTLAEWRREQNAVNVALTGSSSGTGSSGTVGGLDKAAQAAKKATDAFQSMRNDVYSGIIDLNEAIDSYRDAWLGALDDINAKLTGGNDVGAWFEEWRRLGQDIADADKAINDAIAAGDAAAIQAAADRRRLLGGLPTLQDYVAGKTQANTAKANLIGDLFPNLIGTAEGRQILDQFVGLAPEAVQAFVTAYGQANIPALATLLQQQNSETGAVAKLFADSGYYNGVSAAKQTVIALKDQLEADEAKLRRLGEKAGKAIGAGIKAEVSKAISEAIAVAGSGGYGDPIAASLSLQKTVVTATRRLGV